MPKTHGEQNLKIINKKDQHLLIFPFVSGASVVQPSTDLSLFKMLMLSWPLPCVLVTVTCWIAYSSGISSLQALLTCSWTLRYLGLEPFALLCVLQISLSHGRLVTYRPVTSVTHYFFAVLTRQMPASSPHWPVAIGKGGDCIAHQVPASEPLSVLTYCPVIGLFCCISFIILWIWVENRKMKELNLARGSVSLII